jgi:hypothetical protein
MEEFNEDEIKDLYYFLTGGKKKIESATVPKEKIIFGLKNFGLKIPQSDVDYIIKYLNKSDSPTITFEEFKKLWISNIKKDIEYRELAKHTLNMIFDKLYEGEEIKILRKNKQLQSEEFNVNDLETLLLKMNLLQSNNDDNKSKNNSENNNERNKKICKEMINAIDLNGNKLIGVSELTFLLEVKDLFEKNK